MLKMSPCFIPLYLVYNCLGKGFIWHLSQFISISICSYLPSNLSQPAHTHLPIFSIFCRYRVAQKSCLLGHCVFWANMHRYLIDHKHVHTHIFIFLLLTFIQISFCHINSIFYCMYSIFLTHVYLVVLWESENYGK